MERQFLKASLFFLLGLSSCQSNPTTLSSYDAICNPGSLDAECVKEVVISVEESKPVAKNVWEYMIINNSYDHKIKFDEKTISYINNHIKDVDKFNEFLNKSYYFIYYVIQELEAADLPPELALIPFVESNYDPFSISPSGAVGLWQFMPKTGRMFNLEKSWWSEDRHDPYRSTHAAIGYFKYLFNRFDNDLYLALAAYNAGPTYLDRQINKNKRRNLDYDFWSLDLNKQVTEYIPKYIAIREIVFNSEKYGVILPDIPIESVVKKIEIPGQVEILTLSEYLKIPPELIYKLNAGYTKWASPPGNKTIFNVPIELEEMLNLKKDKFIQTNQINWVTHKVSKGDSLWKIAEEFDTEVDVLKKVNYLSSNTLSLNQELLIPLSNDQNQSFIPYQAHIISEGDTLWNLGLRYKISPAEIAKNNGLKMDSPLSIGKELNIGNKNIYRTINSKKRTILYSVKQGDSLYRIADIFNIDIADIKNINELPGNEIKPGQVLKIIIKAF